MVNIKQVKRLRNGMRNFNWENGYNNSQISMNKYARIQQSLKNNSEKLLVKKFLKKEFQSSQER